MRFGAHHDNAVHTGDFRHNIEQVLAKRSGQRGTFSLRKILRQPRLGLGEQLHREEDRLHGCGFTNACRTSRAKRSLSSEVRMTDAAPTARMRSASIA